MLTWTAVGAAEKGMTCAKKFWLMALCVGTPQNSVAEEVGEFVSSRARDCDPWWVVDRSRVTVRENGQLIGQSIFVPGLHSAICRTHLRRWCMRFKGG
jgi:hypothetical protein